MDTKRAAEIVKQYAEVVCKNMSVQTVLLYGSYAHGTQRKDSDIDVAVIVEKITDDFLTSQAFLHKLTRNIDTRIEPVLFEAKTDKSGFVENIFKTGKIIYRTN